MGSFVHESWRKVPNLFSIVICLALMNMAAGLNNNHGAEIKQTVSDRVVLDFFVMSK